MYASLYPAGGVYVPHTMYLPVHGTPPGATLNGLAPNTTAIATSANGMLATTHYYTPFTTAVLTGTLSAAGSTIPSSAFFPSDMTAISMGSTIAGEGPPQLRKLFIGGLNHETTDEQLKDYYSQWGTVVDCIVIRDVNTKHSRGFGFVTFATVGMAETAMAERPHTINGKVVDPKRAIPREQMLPMTANNPPYFLEMEPPTGCKLILSGIHWDFHTVDDLRQYFEKFGDVEQVEIVGQPRGQGFVVYEDKAGAEKCLLGRVHLINGRKIEVKEYLGGSGEMYHVSPMRKHNHHRHHHNHHHHSGSGHHYQSSSLASHGSNNSTPESSTNSDDQSDVSPLKCCQQFSASRPNSDSLSDFPALPPPPSANTIAGGTGGVKEDLGATMPANKSKKGSQQKAHASEVANVEQEKEVNHS